MFGKKKIKKEKKIALCLGGGGARGFAHIGALKAFEEAGFKFDIVAGTSVGALVGAAYAAGTDNAALMKYAENFNMRDVHNGILITPNDPMKIGRAVTELVGAKDISELSVPFAAVAVDLVTAKQAVLASGNLSLAVAASCAVPVLYRPMEIGGKHLVDGGLMNNIPADVCRMLGATHVVTVDVNPSRASGTQGTGIIDVLRTTLGIMMSNSSEDGLRLSDIIVAPDTAKYSSASKNGWESMVKLGYSAAKEKEEEIKALFG